MSSLPSADHSIWSDIITGKKPVQFDFLAAKIFLGRAQMNYKNDPSSLKNLAKEFHQIFEKNINLPTVKKDIDQLH